MNAQFPPFPPFSDRFPFGAALTPPSADQWRQWAEKLSPPDWAVAEVHNRVVLALNHLLQAEPAAQERVRRQRGKVVRVTWGPWNLALVPTAAGLLAVADEAAEPDLRLTLLQTSPIELAQALLAEGKPRVEIQGDVMLAAEVAWLVDNLRWDAEEDLSRWIGDAAAHTVVAQARTAVAALRGFVQRARSAAPDSAPAPTDRSGAA